MTKMKTLQDFRHKASRSAGRSAKIFLLIWACLALLFVACTPADTGTDPQPPGGDDAPPAATPTPTEPPWIEGSIVRGSHDPAANWGAPDVHDDFSGDNPEFELDNAGGLARGWYTNGRFKITFPSRGWWTWYTGNTSVTNFYVDVVVYNGDECVDRDAAGLVYRYVPMIDLAFLFGVSCGGGYFSGISGGMGATGPVCQFIDNFPTGPGDIDCTGLWEHPTSPYIDSGPGAANRIGVLGEATQITLYINGHQVDTVDIPSPLLYAGNFGLYLGPGQADVASVTFDDLSIWINP
jgi:hypothetical protein